MKPETRSKECEAFARMKDICQRHRDVWCKHEASNRAISRLYNSVDMLHGAKDNTEPDYYEPPPSSPHHRTPKGDVLSRMVERLNDLYDLLEGPSHPVGELDLLSLIPPRWAMPMVEDKLVEFCRTVHDRLAEDPAASKPHGRFPYRVRLLNASLKQYTLNQEPPLLMVQTLRTVGTYRRCLNSCIRVLIEMVDPCIPRYMEEPAFQREYQEAREIVMKLTVDARRTYFVEGKGATSLRHKDALKWTPWNDPAAQHERSFSNGQGENPDTATPTT